MKTILVALITLSAATSFASVADARPHHRGRMVQVCHMNHHHRVCHMERRFR